MAQRRTRWRGSDDGIGGTPIEERIVAALLVEKGRLKDADLARARRLQEETGGGLLALLSRLGLVSERDHAETAAEVLGLPLVQRKDAPDAAARRRARSSPRFLKQFHVCPVGEDEAQRRPADGRPAGRLRAGRGAPGDRRARCGRQVALRSEIDDLIERWYGQGRSAMGAIVENADGEGTGDLDDVEHLRDLASEAPVIRLVNLVIQRAVELRASDIHIEPFENRLKVRYRVDGVLEEGESPPANLTAAVISRIKIMAKLNIAERRLPQDGRIMLRVQGKELDLRVSTVPTAHGESRGDAPARPRDGGVRLPAGSASPTHFLPQFQKVLEQPHGILLVTGPTGSGKTTTLYTALSKLNTPDVKIITVEDPVEYQIEGINQIQAKPQIGLDFAHALRSIVRQDPDIIMIGEMRDLETARIAIQSALTGHLVLSHAAHQQRRRRHHPPARHGRGGLPADLHRQRHPRPAPGAPAGADACRALPGHRRRRSRSSACAASSRRARSSCTGRAVRRSRRPATSAAPPSWNSW